MSFSRGLNQMEVKEVVSGSPQEQIMVPNEKLGAFYNGAKELQAKARLWFRLAQNLQWAGPLFVRFEAAFGPMGEFPTVGVMS